MKVPWVPILSILALTAGCRSSPGPSATPPEAATPVVVAAPDASAQFAKFLGNYAQLRPAPGQDGVMTFIDRSADYRPYTKVLFDPVHLYVTPNPEAPEIPPLALKRMSDGLVNSLMKALGPEYQVVTQPGPDVLRLRTAITGIQPVTLPAGAEDYVPFKALSSDGREAAGAGPGVAEMAAAIAVLDPGGKRIAAATATRKGAPTLPQGGQITWNDLQAINDYWAKSFRERLDKLRAAGPPESQ